MDLTADQHRAIEFILNDRERVSSVQGYAGTGKTTVLSALKTEADILTPTNKAAEVLRSKGVNTAKTLHSVLYMPAEVFVFELNGEEVRQTVPPDDDRPYQTELALVSKEGQERRPLALVDEASMVSPDVLEDLLGVYGRVVLIGDPMQLPPVRGADLLGSIKPGVLLTEVHRSALENPLTRFVTNYRLDPTTATPDGVAVVEASENHPRFYDSMAANEARMIVYTNAHRQAVNHRYREKIGRSPKSLYGGEKMICVGRGPGFYNGQEVTVTTPSEEPMLGVAHSVHLDKRPALTIPVWYDPEFWLPYEAKKSSVPIDFAYALTAHKAQGSEFDTVIVTDARRQVARRQGALTAKRWFYTAITRARTKLVISS